MENVYAITPEGELLHWGVKGMKWGIRRYQNEDGTYTDLGKRRYNKEADAGEYYEKSNVSNARYKTKKDGTVKRYNADVDEWVKGDLRANKRAAEEAANLSRNLKKLNDDAARNRKIKPMDLSNMSDNEMRNQINRAMLERQYNDMFNPKKVSRGREYASQILETTGTMLTIGSSALGIALAIKELKG